MVSNGKPTHHLCIVPPSSASAVAGEVVGGSITFNQKSTSVNGLTATIAKLRTKQPSWPVPLDEQIPCKTGRATGFIGETQVAFSQMITAR